jgi:hypothetical protein
MDVGLSSVTWTSRDLQQERLYKDAKELALTGVIG